MTESRRRLIARATLIIAALLTGGVISQLVQGVYSLYIPNVYAAPPQFCVGYSDRYDRTAVADLRGYDALGIHCVKSWYANPPHTDGLNVLRSVMIRKWERDVGGELFYRLIRPYDLRYDDHLTLGLQYALERYPGSLWELGNEPNGQPCPTCPDHRIPPADLAGLYGWLIPYIKDHDPSAVIVGPGLANSGGDNYPPVYMQAVIDAYRPLGDLAAEIDIWNVHTYPQASSTAQIVADFQAFLSDIGKEHEPLYVTEFGYLATYGTDWAIAMMDESIDIFKAAGVDRWYWYSVWPGIPCANGPCFPDTNLFRVDGGLTELGRHYRALAAPGPVRRAEVQYQRAYPAPDRQTH